MNTAKVQQTRSSRRLRWFQCSLRTLLGVMLVAALGMGYVTARMRQATRQRDALRALEQKLSHLTYDCELDSAGRRVSQPGGISPRTALLCDLLGKDFVSEVAHVSFLEASSITDADLEHVGALSGLKELGLEKTQITDAGVKHLEGLKRLEMLSLDNTPIGDAGLEHLKGLTQLQVLGLGGTGVTDAGLKHLKGLTQLQGLELGGTGVTDAGLEHLKGLTQLQELRLVRTQVSDEGVKRLQESLPNCNIKR